MKRKARELRKSARIMRDNGKLSDAGAIYTAAAHEDAGTVTGHSFPEPDRTYAAVSSLCYAATCYRLDGGESLTQNRCDLGILLAKDYSEFIDTQEIEKQSFADLRRGVWPEFIGDLRTIARRDNANDAYDEAIRIYRKAGDYQFVIGEQEHTRLAAYFRSLKRGLGIKIPETAPEQLSPDITFTDWIEYKRTSLPELLNELGQQGTWPSN